MPKPESGGPALGVLSSSGRLNPPAVWPANGDAGRAVAPKTESVAAPSSTGAGTVVSVKSAPRSRTKGGRVVSVAMAEARVVVEESAVEVVTASAEVVVGAEPGGAGDVVPAPGEVVVGPGEVVVGEEGALVTVGWSLVEVVVGTKDVVTEAPVDVVVDGTVVEVVTEELVVVVSSAVTSNEALAHPLAG